MECWSGWVRLPSICVIIRAKGTPTQVCVWSCPNFSAPAVRPLEGVNGIRVEQWGAPDFSTIIVLQLQNLLPAMLAQVSNRGNVRNQNGNVVNETFRRTWGWFICGYEAITWVELSQIRTLRFGKVAVVCHAMTSLMLIQRRIVPRSIGDQKLESELFCGDTRAWSGLALLRINSIGVPMSWLGLVFRHLVSSESRMIVEE
ncbi:hypothetical protein Tco_0964601 [Tanacetum coccineum]